MATVADIMERDPVSVGRDDSVEDVIRTLREHELPGVPVVDGSGTLVGIVTENDLVLRDEDADLHLPHHLDIMGGVIFVESMKHFEGRMKKAFASKAEDMMTAKPITVSPEASVEEAARLIAEHKHNRLPVVDADGSGRLVGVVTRLDVLDALTRT
jgi:CBS domain-containing protein